MKRSLFAVAAMAATFAVGAMAPAHAQTSQPPSAPAPESSSAAPTGATKIAIIAFQPAVASTNEGRAAFEKVEK
jgi:outer membrane protein